MVYPPTIEQVKANPAFRTVLWDLKPSQSGLLLVGQGRTTPAQISWQLHGHGPIRVIFICGFGLVKADFQHQTLFFGHQNGSKYSVLLIDNRGSGGSAGHCRVHRTSTSHMARDILDVADHLGWTGPRELHVCGGSMGGMIAQELAFAAPERVYTLNLWSTTARYENVSESWWEGVRNMLSMVVPRSLEDDVRHIAKIAYTPEWLAAEDDVTLLDSVLGNAAIPRFSNNCERFVAMEVVKRDVPGSFPLSAFVMHVVAAGTHAKSPEQLREIGDRVGRDRIMIVHGVEDKAMSVAMGKKLIDWLQPSKALVIEGLGHAPIHERPNWFNELLAQRFEHGEGLDE